MLGKTHPWLTITTILIKTLNTQLNEKMATFTPYGNLKKKNYWGIYLNILQYKNFKNSILSENLMREIRRRHIRHKMKNEIQDFLL